ncbi:HK97 family phage prohead protease [Lysinibacillus sp. NPDC097287]|uniref:HK97 family phage prohead protease n=1 Tax=Lysinibacillus sp. NPDC097287 TaxID=3364144 RepID=UPI00380737AE
MSQKTAINFQVKQFGEPEERTLRFIGSTEAQDRDGDTISVDGWELENYKKNPVFLWAHDYSIPPIGKAIDVRVRNKQLIFDIEFARTDHANDIYELYRGGFLSATSVGFVGKEGKPTATGVHYTRQELLELSAVPVPSNPTALQQAKEKGLISSGITKYFDTEEYVIEIVEDNSVIEII